MRYDIEWWRGTGSARDVQAVIINAGGIVAYYPSKFPLHHRAEFLGDRDLFGELTTAAHEDGLFVMARMDSNRTAEDFFKAHPDWFARDAAGSRIAPPTSTSPASTAPTTTSTCPDVLREIIERSHPDGFTDNSWAGSAATASATAPTARGSSGRRPASRCRARPTGTTRPTASGSCGATRGGSRSGS